MSTAVTEIRTQAKHRLSELQPYLDEAARLRRVLETLDEAANGVPAQRKPAANKTAAEKTRDGEGGRGRAPQGSNKRRILAVVVERPGVTAVEVARTLGLKRTVVASTMSRLKRTGELEADGNGARVPSERLAEVAAQIGV